MSIQSRENLLQAAIRGIEPPAVRMVAGAEGLSPAVLLKLVAAGRAVIMQRDGKPPLGIGEGLRTKVNANVGTSADLIDPDGEVEKAMAAEKYGADTVTDLSMGGPIDEIFRRIKEATSVPLTTVPIYQAVAEKGSFSSITGGEILRTIRKQIGAGASSVVVHAAITLEMLVDLKWSNRIMGVVTKGGYFT